MGFVESAKGEAEKAAIGAISSVIVAVLVYLATGRNGDLIAWPSERTPLYPSEQTKNLSLPLLLSHTPAKTLTFVNMNISNAGKATIGEQKEPWTLYIAGPPEATIVLLGQPYSSSKRLMVSPAQGSAANTITVQVGSFEPREFFDLRFLVANAPQPSDPRFEVTTSLGGLPRPILTDSSPSDRISHKLLGWLWVMFFGLLMFEAVKDRHAPEKGPGIFREVMDWRRRLVGRTILGAVLAAFAAVFASQFMGSAIAGLWRMGLLS